jgi:LuxR family maltose regulon positive regulatory protein
MELAQQLQDADLIQVARGLGRFLGLERQDDSAAVRDFPEYLKQVTMPLIKDLLLDYETRFLVASGRSDLAWRILQESGINLQSIPAELVSRRLILCLRAAIAGNVDPATTEPALAEALAMTAQSGNRLGQLQLLALTAWQKLKLYGVEAAREALEQAAHLAHETGYVRVLLDIPALATALATAAWLDDETALAALVKGRQLLTEREQEVLALLAENCTYPQMAEKLVISINTVRSHVRHIYRKLAVRRRGQAIRRAQELGLL